MTALGTTVGFIVGAGGTTAFAAATGGVGAPAIPAGASEGAALGGAAGLTLGKTLSPFLFSEGSSSGSEGSKPQDKRLSSGDIKALKDYGLDPHDLKPNSKYDLFKDPEGNISVKPRDGAGPGDPTGYNINAIRDLLRGGG